MSFPRFEQFFSFRCGRVGQLLRSVLFVGQPLDSVFEHFSLLYTILQCESSLKHFKPINFVLPILHRMLTAIP